MTHDILPVCCGCGSLRDEKGAWDRALDYRRTVPSNRLSHGICPPCLERLYPEMAQLLAEKARGAPSLLRDRDRSAPSRAALGDGRALRPRVMP